MTEMKISKANPTILQGQARRKQGRTSAPIFKKLLIRILWEQILIFGLRIVLLINMEFTVLVTNVQSG